MKVKILLVVAVIWMAVIFMFSAQKVDLSLVNSNAVGYTIGRIFVPGFEDMSESEQLEFVWKIDTPIRKGAHMLEYAVLGFLMCMLVSLVLSGMDGKKPWRYLVTGAVSWGLATVYAMTDEAHQLYVPGRGAKISDIIIDSAGALVGVVIGLIVVLSGTVKRKNDGK